MRKWEEKYEKLKNGEYDSRIDELKEQIDNRKANEDTPTQDKKKNKLKDVLSEYEKLTRAKTNLYKIKNVLDYRDRTKKFLEKINKEIDERNNYKEIDKENKELEAELDKLNKELEKTESDLKAEDITPEKKEELDNKKKELKTKINSNNIKYGENHKELRKGLNREGELKDLSDKELKEAQSKAKSRISKCNMVANSLVNGLSWESIDLKLDNWDKGRKLTNKDKDEKLSNKENESNQDQAIDQNNQDQVINENNTDQAIDDNNSDQAIDQENTEQITSENNESNDVISDKKALKRNERLKKRKDFMKNHPRLAKAVNWFRTKVLGKEELLPEQTEQQENKIEDKSEDKSFKEMIKEIAEHGYDEYVKNENEASKKRLAEFREKNGYRQGDTGGTMTKEGKEALNQINKKAEELSGEER